VSGLDSRSAYPDRRPDRDRELDSRQLQGLLLAHRYLAARGTELRIVVWSSELYAALQAAGVTHIRVFSNLESALRAQPARGPDG
jgi:hypothetical protein